MRIRMNTKVILLIGMMMLILVLAQTGTSIAKPITLVFTEHDAKDSMWVQTMIEPWMQEVEKESNGKIVIDRHYGGELFSLMDAYDATVKGVVDMGYTFPNMMGGRFALHGINQLTSSDKLNWRPGMTYWELIQQFPEMQANFDETVLLAVGQFFEPYLGTCRKPIRSFADIKGKRMLAVGEWSGKRLAAWGAVPANVPPEDFFTSLQKGVLDGSMLMLDTLWGISLGQLYKYGTLVSNDSVDVALVMNKKKFNSMPADLQKLMKDMGLKLTQSIDEKQVNSQGELKRRAIKEFGIEFITLPKSELDKFETAGAKVRNEMAAAMDAKGLPGTKVKDAFLAIEEKYSSPEYAPKDFH